MRLVAWDQEDGVYASRPWHSRDYFGLNCCPSNVGILLEVDFLWDQSFSFNPDPAMWPPPALNGFVDKPGSPDFFFSNTTKSMAHIRTMMTIYGVCLTPAGKGGGISWMLAPKM